MQKPARKQGLRIVKRIISLSIENISDRLLYTSVLPQIPGTTVAAPWFHGRRNRACLPQLSGRISFDSLQYSFRFARRRNNCVNMIGSHIDCQERVTTMETEISHSRFNYSSLIRCQNNWCRFQFLFFGLSTHSVWGKQWCVEDIGYAVH